MITFRPARMEDLEAIEEMARLSSGGITTLPIKKRLLHEKIEQSLFAFGKDVIRPKGESYLFVLEQEGECIGCSAIHSQIGEPEPVWALRLGHIHQHSDYLPLDKKLKLLIPTPISTGPSEICTLFLHPDHRQGGLGRLLSLSRFLFMAAFPERFGKEVIALLRGYQINGKSPFWEEVMRPFFEIDFEEADRLRYEDGRFIADLAPKHPLYVSPLPPKARSSIGKAHTHTEPALKLLKGERFHFSRVVDLFDAGPYFHANLSDIRTHRIRQQTRVSRIVSEALHSVTHLTSNDRIDFRACYAHLHFDDRGGAILDAMTAQALGVEEGDTLSYAHPQEEPDA